MIINTVQILQEKCVLSASHEVQHTTVTYSYNIHA